MIQTCKQYYRNNLKELQMIDEFEKNYQSNEAIQWYLNYSFLRKMINKALRIKNIDLLYQQLKLFFDDVVIAKPRSSRNSSVESFIVCRQFHLPDNFIPNIDEPFVYTYERTLNTEEKSSFIIPFIACGSLDGFDSDKTYPLEQEYLEPVQPPIHPAYEEACALKKTKKLPTSSS